MRTADKLQGVLCVILVVSSTCRPQVLQPSENSKFLVPLNPGAQKQNSSAVKETENPGAQKSRTRKPADKEHGPEILHVAAFTSANAKIQQSQMRNESNTMPTSTASVSKKETVQEKAERPGLLHAASRSSATKFSKNGHGQVSELKPLKDGTSVVTSSQHDQQGSKNNRGKGFDQHNARFIGEEVERLREATNNLMNNYNSSVQAFEDGSKGLMGKVNDLRISLTNLGIAEKQAGNDVLTASDKIDAVADEAKRAVMEDTVAMADDVKKAIQDENQVDAGGTVDQDTTLVSDSVNQEPTVVSDEVDKDTTPVSDSVNQEPTLVSDGVD